MAKGTGTYGAVNVFDGGRFSPGNSPGTVPVGPLSWYEGGLFEFEINDAAGTAGVNWDLCNVDGTLSIEASTTPNTKFVIELTSLAGSQPGQAANFDSLQSYEWLIVDTTEGITGFDPDRFALDTTDFSNDLGGGEFGLSQYNDGLYVTFTPIPEPSTLVLLGMGFIGLLMRGWRRREQ